MSPRRGFAASVPSVIDIEPIIGSCNTFRADFETTHCPDMGGSPTSMYMRNPNGCHIHNAGTWFILSPCELDVKSSRSQVNENYWDLTFQAMLGKLYVISLFVTL